MDVNSKNNINAKIQNNSKNQMITTINSTNLYKDHIESKNNSKNKNLPKNFLNNNKIENNLLNKNNMNNNYIINRNPNPQGLILNNNHKIIEELKEKENNKEETPLVARNNRNGEIIFFRKFISENKWTLEDFEIGRKLGSGRFGRVYLVREKKNNFICAIKTIFKRQIESYQMQPQIRRELEIHSHLEHKNILKFYGFFWDERRIFLILEYAPGGEIYKELKNSVIISFYFY